MSQPQAPPRRMPPTTMIKSPRLQALKRKPAADPDSPAPPPARRPVSIIRHGIQWPYYDVAIARNVSYFSFAYGVLKWYEQVKDKAFEGGQKKWRHGTRTGFPTRAEMEGIWLYQLQHSVLPWMKFQSLRSETHKPSASNIWTKMKDDGIDLKRVRNKDPRKKFRKVVGSASRLCPPNFQRAVGGTFNVIQLKWGLKRGRDSEQERSLEASKQTERKNAQAAVKRAKLKA